jgi:hypothetical protein
MTGYKLALLGILSVGSLAAIAADAQAFGKRKKNRGGGDDCECAAPCDPCASGGPMWHADAGQYGAPLAMPGRGTAGVIPADGTQIPSTGGVIPASGSYYGPNSYYGSSSYYGPSPGYYYGQGGYNNNQGFMQGVFQGGTGSGYYPSMSPSNYAGRRLGGLFRGR